jgi:cholesterol oxidase
MTATSITQSTPVAPARAARGTPLSSFPPYFGVRREPAHPPLERIDFAAGDGSALLMHHTSGGTRGPVLLAPGTAMTALSYCIDTVQENLVEFLVADGFDVWLFDWRTSPLLDAHERMYTLDDVGRHDWPAAIAEVRRRTGARQVAVLAHCLSSPCFLLGLLRGHIDPTHVRAFVASQVALHLHMTTVGTLKLRARLDKLLPSSEMLHQKPAQTSTRIADLAVTLLSHLIPKSYSCDNPVCARHSATFGDLILHTQVNRATHNIMGDLIPECTAGFLKDVAVWSRKRTVLRDDDRKHLDRLRVPTHFISGSENRMFVPRGTELSFELLREVNGSDLYTRTVYEGFGHLDCYVGEGAARAIWPDLARTLS